MVGHRCMNETKPQLFKKGYYVRKTKLIDPLLTDVNGQRTAISRFGSGFGTSAAALNRNQK